MSYADRLTDRIDRIDRRLDLAADAALERARRDVKAMRRADALDQEEARSKARRDAERCARHQLVYDQAFQKFGRRAPEPAVDAHPPTYRRKLFSDGQNLLPDGHSLTRFDAADLDGSSVPVLERQLIEELDREAEAPSGSNLPESPDDPRARREVANSMGAKKTEYHARTSFIKDMGRAGRRVLRLVDPRDGRVLLGAHYSRPPT
jgi:hypothetical protein